MPSVAIPGIYQGACRHAKGRNQPRSGRICRAPGAGVPVAAIYTLITTARLNGIDAQAWLADTLHRIVDHPASKLADLLPRNWPPQAADSMGAAA